MDKKYAFIVFDLGNTLIRFDHAISAEKFANLFRLDPKKVYDLFFDSPITRDFETGAVILLVIAVCLIPVKFGQFTRM